jgi:F-type H+-transporting ATPase subunit epsilon
MAQLQCIIVTPEATALDQPADFVALTLDDGEIGIAPGRAPLVGRLGFGELRLRRGEAEQRYYVDGGFVQVAGDVVTVLTNHAVPASEVDSAAAAKTLQAARKRDAHTPESLEIRDRWSPKARGRIRVSRRADESKTAR